MNVVCEICARAVAVESVLIGVSCVVSGVEVVCCERCAREYEIFISRQVSA